mmetsp:Transcript_5361/g.11034  ORF Transcript_5361/g.11034 Transcript_5361/m.11034 type:complete len:86 (+) Transcript_5361:384-641(+)
MCVPPTFLVFLLLQGRILHMVHVFQRRTDVGDRIVAHDPIAISSTPPSQCNSRCRHDDDSFSSSICIGAISAAPLLQICEEYHRI